MMLQRSSDFERILFDEETIQRRLKGLAREILDKYHGRELVWLTVMKGADNSSRDLRRELVELSFLTYGSLAVDLIQDQVIMSLYSNPDNPQKGPTTILGLDPEIDYRWKDVLIVEDIVDRGWTLYHLKKHLGEKSPASIEICSLLSKPSKREVELEVDYLGFEVGDFFVVGYGLDLEQKYRDLPFIGVLKEEVWEGRKKK